jgi:hypothetical protein
MTQTRTDLAWVASVLGVIGSVVGGAAASVTAEPSSTDEALSGNIPCCVSDTECVVVSGSECNQLRGWQHRDAATCAEVDCTPSGACCRQGFCWTLDESRCDALSAVFLGVDTACTDPDVCDGPCCLSDVACVVTSREACDDLLGWYTEPGPSCDGTDCTPTGACCGFGQCLNLDEDRCRVSEGTFRGPDSSCADPDICDEPCCFGDSCTVVDRIECWEAGGYPQGPFEMACGPCSCHRYGACCLPGGECVIDHETSCSPFSGETYLSGACRPDSCDCNEDANCQSGEPGDLSFCDDGFCRSLAALRFDSFLACYTGPNQPPADGCWCADRNSDGEADLLDVAVIFNAAEYE